jgi:hypothetical protein
VHQLYVQESYPGAERNWNAARLAYGGGMLRFIAINKQEITCDYGCSYAEEFGASVPDALLRASSLGFMVVFTARSGLEKMVVVPGDLIAKQPRSHCAKHSNAGTRPMWRYISGRFQAVAPSTRTRPADGASSPAMTGTRTRPNAAKPRTAPRRFYRS